jgi:hypothetical protein
VAHERRQFSLVEFFHADPDVVRQDKIEKDLLRAVVSLSNCKPVLSGVEGLRANGILAFPSLVRRFGKAGEFCPVSPLSWPPSFSGANLCRFRTNRSTDADTPCNLLILRRRMASDATFCETINLGRFRKNRSTAAGTIRNQLKLHWQMVSFTTF